MAWRRAGRVWCPGSRRCQRSVIHATPPGQQSWVELRMDPGSLGTHADGDHYYDDDDYSDDSDDDMPPLINPNDDDYSNLGYAFVYPLPPTPMNE